MAKIFKDLLSVDAAAIMNVTEFAEFLQVNGVLLACQFIASTGKISSAEKDQKEGLNGDFATLYFKTTDYTRKSEKPLPKQGDWIYLQAGNFKKRYRVEVAEDELGVTHLELAILRENRGGK